MCVSRDGSARLLAGALPNDDGLNLRDYRELVLQQSYPGAAIDYAPVRDNWFVLSGMRDGMMFYERVTFTCGGRRINSWALLYPDAERRRYDRVVEQVARSYRAGEGSCGSRYSNSVCGTRPICAVLAPLKVICRSTPDFQGRRIVIYAVGWQRRPAFMTNLSRATFVSDDRGGSGRQKPPCCGGSLPDRGVDGGAVGAPMARAGRHGAAAPGGDKRSERIEAHADPWAVAEGATSRCRRSHHL